MLIIDRKDTVLEILSDRLIVRVGDERPRTIPLILLERVLIYSRTFLDSAVLAKLAEAGVPVLILSPKKTSRVAILLGKPHNDARVRLAQMATILDTKASIQWAIKLVARKIRNQKILIHTLGRMEKSGAFQDLMTRLDQCLVSVEKLRTKAHDSANVLLAKLQGFEGSASAISFEALALALPDSLGFVGRKRRPPPDPVNALLSLTYTLLHFEAVSMAYATGLDPYLGFYHKPSFKRESLASDLIEPLRPHVDRWVWMLFKERHLRAEHFSMQNGMSLLGKAGRGIFFAQYEAQLTIWRKALRRSIRLLAQHLRQAIPLDMIDHGDNEEESALP